jgi:hypothetical protein
VESGFLCCFTIVKLYSTMAAGCRQRSAPANKHFAEGGNCRHGIERPEETEHYGPDATSVVSMGPGPNT